MNNNIVKTGIVSLAAGVLFAVLLCVVLLITNAIGVSDLTNTQLSDFALKAFIAGLLLMVAYSLATKRQW